MFVCLFPGVAYPWQPIFPGGFTFLAMWQQEDWSPWIQIWPILFIFCQVTRIFLVDFFFSHLQFTKRWDEHEKTAKAAYFIICTLSQAWYPKEYFTFMTLQGGDGGVGLLFQFQQRDLSWVITHKGVLCVVIVSEGESQGFKRRWMLKNTSDGDSELRAETECLRLKDTVGRRPRRWSSVSPACFHSGCTSSSRSCRGPCSPATHSPERTPYLTLGSGGLKETGFQQVTLNRKVKKIITRWYFAEIYSIVHCASCFCLSVTIMQLKLPSVWYQGHFRHR